MKSEHLFEKPYSDHPDDSYLFVVLRRNFKGEYVTHLFNNQSGGYSNGHYFEEAEEALADYRKRGLVTRRWKCSHGHTTERKLKPDLCRECKKTETALWLSRFTEILPENPPTESWEEKNLRANAFLGNGPSY